MRRAGDENKRDEEQNPSLVGLGEKKVTSFLHIYEVHLEAIFFCPLNGFWMTSLLPPLYWKISSLSLF